MAYHRSHSPLPIPHSLFLKLHPSHAAPGYRVKDEAYDADDQDLEPYGRPPAALQQGVAHDLDVVLSPYEVGEPTQARRDVLDRKQKAGEQKYQQEAAESYQLHRGRLARNGGPDHRPERCDTEGVQDCGHDEWGRIAGQAKPEISKEQDEPEQ